MKILNFSKLFAATALVLSLSSFTIDGPDSKDAAARKFDASLYQIGDTQKVRLSVDKTVKDKLKVILTDKSGRVYYSATVPRGESQYRVIFNLDELSEGDYNFELFHNGEKLSKQMKVSDRSERTVSLR